MNQRRSVMITVALALAVTLGYLFGGQQKGIEGSTIESYSVPPEKADEIRQALRNLFPSNKDGANEGSVQLVGGNMLIVRTTKQMQSGVGKVIREYRDRKNSVVPIRFEYWQIASGNGTATTESYGELAEVVDSLKKTQVGKNFQVVDHSEITTLNHESGESQNNRGSTRVKVNPKLGNNKILAEVSIRSELGQLDSNVQATPGQFVVLGQNMVVDSRSTEKFEKVFHVIRASVIQ